jgi:hypothetical protein
VPGRVPQERTQMQLNITEADERWIGMAPAGYGCGWNHPIPIPIILDLTHHLYPYPPTGTKFSHTRHPPG